MKKIILSGVALTAMAVLAGCGAKASDTDSAKQTMKLAVTSDIATMDPAHASDTTSMQMLENTGEGFLQLGKNSSIEKALATSITTSKDGKVYTFKLRKDAKWSNGDKVTADDFVYGWQRTVNPKTASEYAYLYSGIKNADAILAGKVNYKQLGVKATDAYTVQVTLEHPISYFKLLVAMPVFYPQNQTAVEKYGKQYGTSAATTVNNGPFKLKNWDGTNQNWSLVKNSTYWDKKAVHLDAIKFQVIKDPTTGLDLYNNQQLDQALLIGAQVANEKSNADYVLNKSATSVYLQFNMAKPSNAILKKAFNNVNIRKALSLTLNRKQFVNNVLNDGSIAPTGFVTGGLANGADGTDFAKAAYVKSGVAYDKTEAKKLWAKGLKEIGTSSLAFTVLTDDDSATKSTIEFVQGQWESALPGAKVTIQSVPKATRIDRSSKGDFDIAISGWGADFSDPITFLNLYQTGNSGNAGGYKDATYNKLITEINTSNDAKVRWTDMVKAEKILMKDQVTIPLYQKSYSYLQNKNIKNLIVNTAGPAHSYKGVTIK